MADEVDLANRHVQMELDIALSQIASAQLANAQHRSEHCLNCGEHVRATFCDADCREDYEKRRYTHSQRYTEH